MAHKLGGMIGTGALLLACGTVRVAVAQDTVPTDAELRSAYCIPVLQSEIKMLSDAVASMDRWGSQNDQSFQQNPPSLTFRTSSGKIRSSTWNQPRKYAKGLRAGNLHLTDYRRIYFPDSCISTPWRSH